LVPGPEVPHGFLGLLAAFRLRQARGAKFTQTLECLAEPDARAFDFSNGIQWNNQHVTAKELAKVPQFAIGSCSLHEPDQELADQVTA
jgi:hypothetical protein